MQDHQKIGDPVTDDAAFIRTEDIVCLACTTGAGESCKSYLSGYGFASQVCSIEREPKRGMPCNIWKHMFQIEDAISVHAVQGWTKEEHQGGKRSVLYGQAVLLRNCASLKLLRCLSTKQSGSRRDYQIGFRGWSDKSCIDGKCWFAVLPVSGQRSEGEKVQAGDDIYFVNLATQRYLSLDFSLSKRSLDISVDEDEHEYEELVVASFTPCPWTMDIIVAGQDKEKFIGYLNGGDVIQIHRRQGKDEYLTTASYKPDDLLNDSKPDLNVRFKKGQATEELKSLWLVQLCNISFGGAFIAWGQPIRLLHLISGQYLGIDEHDRLVMLDPSDATGTQATFCFVKKGKPHGRFNVPVLGMGTPQVKFGDAVVFLETVGTARSMLVGVDIAGRSLSKHRRPHSGTKTVMQRDFHDSYSLMLTRCGYDLGRCAAITHFSEQILRSYAATIGKSSLEDVDSAEKVLSDPILDKTLEWLEDIGHFFKLPDKETCNVQNYQEELYKLRTRQDLVSRQALLKLTFATLKLASGSHCSGKNLEIQLKLCGLIVSLVRGNHSACSKFASEESLTSLVQFLSIPHLSGAILKVIHCLLEDSPEVLVSLTNDHVDTIINTLHKNGRDKQVMKLLKVLCVCQGVAMREKQRKICDNLLQQCGSLLIHTSLIQQLHCFYANIFIDTSMSESNHPCLYFELHINQHSEPSHSATSTAPHQPPSSTPKRPHLRVGWADFQLFSPYPTSNGRCTTSGGIGDNFASVGFDGEQVWLGGHSFKSPSSQKYGRLHKQNSQHIASSEVEMALSSNVHFVSSKDVIGCCLDLRKREVRFTRNGWEVPIRVRLETIGGETETVLVPAVSVSGGIENLTLHLGGPQDMLCFPPPDGYSPVGRLASDKSIQLCPFLELGNLKEMTLLGPTIIAGQVPFTPQPIDTSQVVIPDFLTELTHKLADNMHQNWAKIKINNGFKYGLVRDDEAKVHPSLRSFDSLPSSEQEDNKDMATSLIATLLVLECNICVSAEAKENIQYDTLPSQQYEQSNGFIPRPISLPVSLHVDPYLSPLIDTLAENTHNAWARKKMDKRWTYGLAKGDCKRSHRLVPFQCLSEADQNENRELERDNLRTIAAMGYLVSPPPLGQMMALHSVSDIPFRTFRGQYAPYCSGKGKWYFKVRLMKGYMMRVGWATRGFSPSVVLGNDSHSYAIDGYQGCKWHGGVSKKFGDMWKTTDVLSCLLDLDSQTMSFARNGQPLSDESGDHIAFRNFPKDLLFVPAVTTFLGEEVELILTKSQKDVQEHLVQSGYEAVMSSIRANIPIWYSDTTPIFKEVYDTSSHLTVTSKNDTMSIHCTDTIRSCIRTNVGVHTLCHTDDRASNTSVSSIVEDCVGFPLENNTCARTGMKVSYSVEIPAGQDPAQVFLGWTTPSFQYSAETTQFDCEGPDVLYGTCAVVTVDQRRGPHGSGTASRSPDKKLATAFLVRMSSLLVNAPPHLLSLTRVRCILETTTGELTISCPESSMSRVLHVTNPCKLFPTLIIVPSHEHVADIQFAPEEGCQPVAAAIMPHGIRCSGNLLSQMKLTILTHACWHQLEETVAKQQVTRTCSCSYKVDPTQSLATIFPVQTPPVEIQKPFADSSTVSVDPTLSLSTFFPAQSPQSEVEKSLALPWLGPTSFGGGGLPLPICLPKHLLMYATLPQEDRVIGFTELVEHPQLLAFHLESLRTLRATCLHDNMLSAEQVSRLVDWDQLLHCIKTSRWDWELRAEYFKLLNTLYLEHEVSTRLMMRGEYVFAVQNTAIPTHDDDKGSRRNRGSRRSLQPLIGISHDLTATFAGSQRSLDHYHRLNKLKDVVLNSLEVALRQQVFHCRMLVSSNDKGHLLMPLLTALDSFLVLGYLRKPEDRQRLLAILHPSLSIKNDGVGEGLLTIPSNEPIKMLLCNLLEHLCDCQLLGRVEHIVKFAEEYVIQLQKDQKKRAEGEESQSMKVFRELRTQTEKQLAAMLSLERDNLQNDLLVQLKDFHAILKRHCGNTEDSDPSKRHYKENLTKLEKLEKLTSLIIKAHRHCSRERSGETPSGEVGKLQEVIITTLIKWAKEGAQDTKLGKQIFLLLYRQFTATEELSQALQKTYILEKASDYHDGGILDFQTALGRVRMMLQVGLGTEEECLLEDMLQKLRKSELFSQHPDLMRMMDVHITVMNVVKTYLSYSSNTVYKQDEVIPVKQKLKMTLSPDDIIGPVEECCKFLCEFAHASRQNQNAMFEHMGYLLDQSKQYADRLSGQSYSPLDVATATIQGNLNLVSSLSEETLERVVVLMDGMTVPVGGQDSSFISVGGSSSSLMPSASREWAPVGAEKCLRFLQAAVLVDGETVTHNAATIVRLLIQHPDCLGPGYSGQSLELNQAIKEAFSLLSSWSPKAASRSSSLYRQDTMVSIQTEPVAGQPVGPKRNSSTFSLNVITAELTIQFYSSLIRLLASCVTHTHNKPMEGGTSSQTNEKDDHIKSFMQSLVSLEELKEILSFQLAKKEGEGMSATCKESILMFMNNVYDIEQPEFLMELITDVFLPDIRVALEMDKVPDKYSHIYIFRYLFQHVLSFIKGHTHLFQHLFHRLPVITTFVLHCYQLSRSVLVPDDKIVSFLSAMSKALPPQAVLKLVPTILPDIPSLSPRLKVAVRVLTAHFEHYNRYYTSGVLTASYHLCPPTKQEKAYISLLYYQLLSCTKKQLPVSQQEVVSCLQALSCALTPDCLVPSLKKTLDQLSVPMKTCQANSPYSSSENLNETELIETAEVKMSQQLTECMKDFAKHCHEHWVYIMQQKKGGWRYGPQFDSNLHKDPNIRPFHALDVQDQAKVIQPAKQCLQLLLSRGCVFHFGNSSFSRTVPHKKKLICLMPFRKKKNGTDPADKWKEYEPNVLDLDKVDASIQFLVTAESTAHLLEQVGKADTAKVARRPSEAKTQISSVYDPISIIYGGWEVEHIYNYVVDLFKFLKVKGQVFSGAFITLPGDLRHLVNQNTTEHKPFGAQMFEIFTTAKTFNCICLETAIEIYSTYLSRHASYYNPCLVDSDRKPAIATAGEKKMIAENLRKLHSYVSKQVSESAGAVFKTCSDGMKDGQSNGVHGEQSNGMKGGQSNGCGHIHLDECACARLFVVLKEKNTRVLQNYSKLSTCFVRAIDTSDKDVIKEVGEFFTWANGEVKKMVAAMNALIGEPSEIPSSASFTRESAQKTLLYCLQVLLPTITTLCHQFHHRKAPGPSVTSKWPDIFKNLYECVDKHTVLFIDSSTLPIIGRTVASMCLVYPNNKDGSVFGWQREKLIEELRCAAGGQLSRERLCFVASVLVPVLVSSLTGPSKSPDQPNQSEVDTVLKLSLRVMVDHYQKDEVSWMHYLADGCHQLAKECSCSLLNSHLLPPLVSLAGRCHSLWEQQQLFASSLAVREDNLMQKQHLLGKKLKIFARDLTAFLPFLKTFCSAKIEYLWSSQQNGKALSKLYISTGTLANIWFSSKRLRYLLDTECKQYTHFAVVQESPVVGRCCFQGHNALLDCAELLLERLPRPFMDVVDRFQEYCGVGMCDFDIEEEMRKTLEVVRSRWRSLPASSGQASNPVMDKVALSLKTKADRRYSAEILQIFAQLKQFMLKSHTPSQGTHKKWKELLSHQRRKAIIECLCAVPFYKLKRHRAVNLFLQEYSRSWLTDSHQASMERLCEELLDKQDHDAKQLRQSNELVKRSSHEVYDPLEQLFSMFKTQASSQQWKEASLKLYGSYLEAIVKSTEWLLEDEADSLQDESAAKAYERFQWRIAQISIKQDQLLRRGADRMLLSVLAVVKGKTCPLTLLTLQIGILMLEGGNQDVQEKMLKELVTMDVEFYSSIHGFINSSSVLDWHAYERNQKSLTAVETSAAKKAFYDLEQTVALFRFLQLLCEGHNEKFQNHLRTQERNTTTVNIVVATVDYLLRLQESIRDFYWHHAQLEGVEGPARESFQAAFKVTGQVFRTLTEYIQGPCVANQKELAKSRLWDAVSGFLHIFAALQKKLYRHTNHVELLREMLNLQEEFFVLLLSMLEGSTVGTPIGHNMLNMMQESMHYIQELITFYNVFIKLKDATTAKAFRDYDLNKDGFISYREFEKAMLAQQHYTKAEIDYLMQCADTNKDGLLDYMEFTERFHHPAHKLGFHLCTLIKQLSDVLPGDHRLEKLQETCQELNRHFEPTIGCVEIMGKNKQVERVYFPIKVSCASQWSEPQIKASRREFLREVNMNTEKTKLSGFVSFCEDTIFEMNYSDMITGAEQMEREQIAEKHRMQNINGGSMKKISLTGRLNARLTAMRLNNPHHVIFRAQAFFVALWALLCAWVFIPTCQLANFTKLRITFLWHKGEGPIHPRGNDSSCFAASRIPNITSYAPNIVYSFRSFTSVLACNYYRLRSLLLVVTMLINLLLLTFQAEDMSLFIQHSTDNSTMLKMEFQDSQWTTILLYYLTHVHFALSSILIVSYWHLKVPLIIFKQEKRIVRSLELKNWNHFSYLDKVVIRSTSFPREFWDKQVKQRTLQKIEVERRPIFCKILGIEFHSKFDKHNWWHEFSSTFVTIFDWRYRLWEVGMVITDVRVIYHIGYCFISLIGLQWSYFYFSIHLLDLMLESKLLVTVLNSLLIHGKQLIMTLAMTCVVIYIYTVIAFNFFHKFYIHHNGDLAQDQCQSMWRCFLFHLDQGLRSGGGIADVLVSAVGDQQEFLRLFFDMTFFFFVIVILLAIIQGLIIDAFGELREKEEALTDQLKNKCFVCGMGRSDFDNPHEFETHTRQHHSMRNYLFFLMHLIGKPETEFTGQESYVWNMYLQQKWEFFPLGVCFQLQERQKAKEKASQRQQREHRSPSHPLLSHAHTLSSIPYT